MEILYIAREQDNYMDDAVRRLHVDGVLVHVSSLDMSVYTDPSIEERKKEIRRASKYLASVDGYRKLGAHDPVSAETSEAYRNLVRLLNAHTGSEKTWIEALAKRPPGMQA